MLGMLVTIFGMRISIILFVSFASFSVEIHCSRLIKFIFGRSKVSVLKRNVFMTLCQNHDQEYEKKH